MYPKVPKGSLWFFHFSTFTFKKCIKRPNIFSDWTFNLFGILFEKKLFFLTKRCTVVDCFICALYGLSFSQKHLKPNRMKQSNWECFDTFLFTSCLSLNVSIKIVCLKGILLNWTSWILECMQRKSLFRFRMLFLWILDKKLKIEQ